MHREWRERFPRHRLKRKPLVSYLGMHVRDRYLTRRPWASYQIAATHVPWCMSGSLTRGGGENVSGACATRNLRIWEEVHCPHDSRKRILVVQIVCSDVTDLCTYLLVICNCTLCDIAEGCLLFPVCSTNLHCQVRMSHLLFKPIKLSWAKRT